MEIVFSPEALEDLQFWKRSAETSKIGQGVLTKNIDLFRNL
jgi:Txe/YoeB family toxin of Txe-Axe toxin-antitoxin module